MLFGESIHAGPCREVIGVLRAAMQHDQQSRLVGVTTVRNIELVASASSSAGIGPTQKLGTVRNLEGLARPDARQSINPKAWKLGPTERRGNVTRRPPAGPTNTFAVMTVVLNV